MPKTPTFHKGAEMERRAFKSFLRRQKKTSDGKIWAEDALEWVERRCDRYKKRKGGL
jgi:hypothetical protein